MRKTDRPMLDSASLLQRLGRPVAVSTLGPMAARFVHSLRLIALHERAGRDAVPELAARLGSFDVAAKSLALAQTVAATWPENVHVSRFCCQRLTHDEATIGALIDRAWARDRAGFDAQIDDLVRPARVQRLWDAVLALVAAEASAG